MRKQYLFVFLITFSLQKSYSQTFDSIKHKYLSLNITRYGSGYMKGSERVGINELRSEFSMSPVELELYTKAMKYRKVSKILNYGAIAFSIAAGAIVAKNNSRGTAIALAGGAACINNRYYEIQWTYDDHTLPGSKTTKQGFVISGVANLCTPPTAPAPPSASHTLPCLQAL